MKWAKRKLVKHASKMMNKWFDSKIANVNNSLLGLLTEKNKTIAQSGNLGTYLSNVIRVTLGTLPAFGMGLSFDWVFQSRSWCGQS